MSIDQVVAYIDDAISNCRDNIRDIKDELDSGDADPGALKMLTSCEHDLRAFVRVRKNLHEYMDDRHTK